MTESAVCFLLNNELVTIENIDPNLTILQYLREIRFKTGTKEGCASGDCGACTVVLAELVGEESDRLQYKSVNACITFIANVHGKQLITVEDLKAGDRLHHTQQAIVDNHATQCGFCTPGFVMSSFALHQHNPSPDRNEVLEALAGNLCRCTGYRSIIEAAVTSNKGDSKESNEDNFSKHYRETVAKLLKIKALPSAVLEGGGHSYSAPKTIQALASELVKSPKATLLAGGTDLALSVTQNLTEIDNLIYLGNVQELVILKETTTHIVIGAALPYSQFIETLNHYYPDFGDMIERIGSKQIRNTGTLGGNIGNASPIGDMPPALIALGATVTLHLNGEERTILVEDYFVDYKKTVLKPSEFIKSIQIPKPTQGQMLKLYKISKRIDDDISAVLTAIFVEQDAQQRVTNIRMAYGGMAAIPKRALNAESALKGQLLTKTAIQRAQQALSVDFNPLSDVRASDKYRMAVAQNLIEKCYIELQNKPIETRVVNYA